MDDATPSNSCGRFQGAPPWTMQELIEILPACALLIDAEGKIAAANPQAEWFLGLSTAQLKGWPLHEILQCSSQVPGEASDECPVGRSLGGTPVAGSRLWLRCRTGVFKPVEYRCTPQSAFLGQGAVLTFNEITRQLDVERDLRRLASVAEASPMAIVLLNEDGNIIHANSAMLGLIDRFGFGPDLRPAVFPSRLRELIAHIMQGQSPVGPVEVCVGERYFEWQWIPVAAERMVRGYGVDLSAHKQAARRLIEAKADAELALITKAEFLANKRDGIRTPLNAIVEMTELLASGELADGARERVHTIRACAEKLTNTLDELLEWADLEAGKFAVRYAPIDLHGFFEAAVAPYRWRAEQRGLQFGLEVGDGLPPSFLGDRELFMRTLGRLIDNAIKYTERGKIAVRIEHEPAAECDDDPFHNAGKLVVSVCDTGVGIPLEQHSALLRRCPRAEYAKSSRTASTGLGLAIAKRAVELMGGRLGLESELGTGSRFWLSLPVQSASSRVGSAQGLTVEKPGPAHKTATNP